MTCLRCIVSGRVQGVWYRETTRQQANRLGLTGSASNLPDGTVEVIICGASDAVDELLQWLWQGSSHSRVTSVECHTLEEAQPPMRFTTG